MKKILVLDDDEDMLNLVKLTLEEAEYEVTILSNPNEIYPVFYEYNPDLVILDVHLKGVDGQAISRELKDLKEDAKVAVLLCSGDKEIAEDLIESRAQGFLLKPFKKEELISKVESILRSHANTIIDLPTKNSFIKRVAS